MTTIDADAARPSTSLARSALIAGVILLGFTAYSLWVVAGHGYLGFVHLAGREPWALQMLLDLVIACAFGVGWMHADARKRGLRSWPFVPVVIGFGSIGLLAYVVWRRLVSVSP
ncbi:MAG TPA: hypothetical protein VM734_32545 [Kofleriaceae bacterium]|nr:hypothetical protein [Kofleriaceae bacterium]